MLRKGITGVLVIAFSLIGYAYQTSLVSIQTPASAIADANESFQLQISTILEQKARTLGLTLDTSDLVSICRDDFVMVNAGVAGFESVESSANMIVLDLAMIYVSQDVNVRFGDGKFGPRLPAGFYVVRATVNQSSTAHDPGITLLEVFNSSGHSLLKNQASTLAPSDRRTLTASLGVGSNAGEGAADVACVGWITQKFGCELCVALGSNT